MVVDAVKRSDLMVTAQGYDVWGALHQIRNMGGPRVVVLGHMRSMDVPVELHRKTVSCHELIVASATARGLNVAWRHEGKFAILYAGAADAEVAHVRKDLTPSSHVSLRRDAAWRCKWLSDPAVVPLLVQAAKDPDADVAWLARESLRYLSWSAAAALDEAVIDLLQADLNGHDTQARVAAIRALKDVGGDKVLALLETACSDQDIAVRGAAVTALGSMDGEKVQALLGKALSDPSADVKWRATQALSFMGMRRRVGSIQEPARDERSIEQLEKALADPDGAVRSLAVEALRHAGRDNGKVLSLLETVLADQDPNLRMEAVMALGSIGGDGAVMLIEKAFADRSSKVAFAAARALVQIGGERATATLERFLTGQDARLRQCAVAALDHKMGGDTVLTLLEKALADPDIKVRTYVPFRLSSVGGEKMLALFEKALSDPSPEMREISVRGLGGMRKERLCAILLNVLATEKNVGVLRSACGQLRRYGSGDPGVVKAVEEAEARLSKDRHRNPIVPDVPAPMPQSPNDGF